MTEIEILIKTVVEDTRKALKGVADDLKGVSDGAGGMSGVTDALGNLGRAAGGIALEGLQALGGVLMDSLQAAADAEKGQAALNSVLLSTKGAAGVTADAANELASSLQKITPFEDDVVLGAENMLLTFTNIHQDVFPKATETVLNLAQAMGGDAKGAAIQLGKALNDPEKGISALSRVGVTFTEEQKAQIKAMQDAGNMAGAQGIILKELETEFGGAARAAGGTFAGQLAIAQHALGDVEEAIGGKLLPILTPLIGKVGQFAEMALPPLLDGLDKLLAGVQTVADYFNAGSGEDGIFGGLISAVAGVMVALGMSEEKADSVATGLWNTFKDAWASIKQIWAQAKIDIGEIIDSLMLLWRSEFGAIESFLDGNSEDIKASFASAWTQIKTIVSAAVAIVKIVLRELALFVATHGTEISGLFKGAWEIIKGVVDGALTLISGILTAALKLMQGDTSGALDTLKGTFTRVWDDIKGIVKGAWDFISNIVNLAIDAINRLSGAKASAYGASSAPLGGSYGTQSVKQNSFALGGDTYNVQGDMNTAREIQAARQDASRRAQLRAAFG